MLRNKTVALVLLFSFTTFFFAPLAQAATNAPTPQKLEWTWISVPAGYVNGNVWISQEFVQNGFTVSPNEVGFDKTLLGVDWSKYPLVDLGYNPFPHGTLSDGSGRQYEGGITSGVGYQIPYADLMAINPNFGVFQTYAPGQISAMRNPAAISLEWTWLSVPAGSLSNGNVWISQEFVQKGFSVSPTEYDYDITFLNVDWSKYSLVDLGYNPFPQYSGITSGIGYQIPYADLMAINPNLGILNTYNPSQYGPIQRLAFLSDRGDRTVYDYNVGILGHNIYLINWNAYDLTYVDASGVHKFTTTYTSSGGGFGSFFGAMVSIGLSLVGVPPIFTALVNVAITGQVGIGTALSAVGFADVMPPEIIQAAGYVNTAVNVIQSGNPMALLGPAVGALTSVAGLPTTDTTQTTDTSVQTANDSGTPSSPTDVVVIALADSGPSVNVTPNAQQISASQDPMATLVQNVDYNNTEDIAAARKAIVDAVKRDVLINGGDAISAAVVSTQAGINFDKFTDEMKSKADEIRQVSTETNSIVASIIGTSVLSGDYTGSSHESIMAILTAKTNLSSAYIDFGLDSQQYKDAETALNQAISADQTASALKEALMTTRAATEEQTNTAVSKAIDSAMESLSQNGNLAKGASPSAIAAAVAGSVAAIASPEDAMYWGIIVATQSDWALVQLDAAVRSDSTYQSAVARLNADVANLPELPIGSQSSSVSTEPTDIGPFAATRNGWSNFLAMQQSTDFNARIASPQYASAKDNYDQVYQTVLARAQSDLINSLVPIVASAVSETTGIPVGNILSQAGNASSGQIVPEPQTSFGSPQNIAPSLTEMIMSPFVQAGQNTYSCVSDVSGCISNVVSSSPTPPPAEVTPPVSSAPADSGKTPSVQPIVTNNSPVVTASPTPTPALSISCSGVPGNPYINQSVVWSSVVTGGSGSYIYEWTSATNPELFETIPSFIKSYATAGQKRISLSVTDPASHTTATAVCSAGANQQSGPTSNTSVASVNVGACAAVFSADFVTVEQGQEVRLSWNVPGGPLCATSCSGNDFDTGGRTESVATVAPTPANHNYTLSCVGGTYGPPPDTNIPITVHVPTATISANPLRVSADTNTNVVWRSSSNTASCRITKNPTSSGWPKTELNSSADGISDKVTAQTMYTIYCVNDYGIRATDSVVVNIIPVFNEFL